MRDCPKKLDRSLQRDAPKCDESLNRRCEEAATIQQRSEKKNKRFWLVVSDVHARLNYAMSFAVVPIIRWKWKRSIVIPMAAVQLWLKSKKTVSFDSSFGYSSNILETDCVIRVSSLWCICSNGSKQCKRFLKLLVQLIKYCIV